MATRKTVFVAIVVGIACVVAVQVSAQEGLPERSPGTVRLEGDPDGLPEYTIVKAFPNLRFERPTCIASPRDGSDSLFVAEQDGRIKGFENDRDTKKTWVALDIRKKVSRQHNEEGLLGLAFDPAFKKNRAVFAYYSTSEPRRTVLMRYKATSNRRYFDRRSESLVLRQRQPTGSHNGGCMAFGPDGMLYLSIGDGGEAGDPHGHGQNLQDWLGTILRIDVSGAQRFAVPPDNPFANTQHVRPEIWAYGFANVRGLGFDSVTGDLWASDAGAGKFEEINHVRAGSNYGWPLREGADVHSKGNALTPLRGPVAVFPRGTARRLVGGIVYRGRRLPQLVGAYLCADYETGTMWALRFDGTRVKERRRLGRAPGITHFGTDAAGEVLCTAADGYVYTLAPWSGDKSKAVFPQRLSETGLFSDIASVTPIPALIPYDVSTPLWSDGAGKSRFVMLPDLEKVKIAKDGTYDFPVGTIFVKHFFQGATIESAFRRLETRLYTRGAEGWAGYTYVWSDDRSDAFLIDGRVEKTFQSDGKVSKWTFPSRGDCSSCHTAVANEILGFRREQLDISMKYGDLEMNQLDALEAMGVFEGKNKRKHTWPAWPAEGEDLDRQVRAYLDANCAMCHQPDGPGNANIDLRYDTPLKKTNVLDRKPGMWNLGVFDARLIAPGDPERSILYLRMKRTDLKGMPTIAHNIPDENALARIEKWIRAMPKK